MGMIIARGRNLAINGMLDHWQRGTSFAAIANSTYFADRFLYLKNGTMVHTVSQDTDVPTFAQAGIRLKYSSKLLVTTNQASLSAGNYVSIGHRIEGYLLEQISGRYFTVSFWVKSDTTGTYPVSFWNSAQDRCYVTTYTVSAAATWEKKTVTVLHDTTGTWLYDTGMGLDIRFTIGAGSTYQTGSTNAWQAGAYLSTASCVNAVATNSTNFRIAGVMVNEGHTAARPDRFGGDVMSEFAACQRYLWRISGQFTTYFNAQVNTATQCYASVQVPMRVQPAFTVNAIQQNDGAGQSAISAVNTDAWSPAGFSFRFTATGMNVGRATLITGTGAGSYFQADAEL